MKGGITSGVIYPWAIAEFARTYRLRGLGGASAGAIGAALGAAAEYGRPAGGFDVLLRLPRELGDGKLGRLFQPQPSMRAMLAILLAVTGHDKPGAGTTGAGRFFSVLWAVILGFPLACLLGVLPGAALLVRGVLTGDGWLIVAAVLVLLVGLVVAVLLRVWWKLTRSLPENLFGICRGTAVGGKDGFTDWLADTIDAAAKLPKRTSPLTFGHLRTNPDPEHWIDLRMVTTCLTRETPYELPLQSYEFFYDPAEWATLFPGYVMKALDQAPPGRRENLSAAELADFVSDEAAAAAHQPSLRRLPGAADLPVIIATRLSLSFPLLISAIPIWIVEHHRGKASFDKHWFTDGGFCSNFPVHMFDEPLPSRPTFAINLGTMDKDWGPEPDQRKNLKYVKTNSDGLSLPYQELPRTGLAAVSGFAVGAFGTSRNWSDNSYLRYPGHRDRTVVIKQSKAEGGLNLFMRTDVILGLAARGREAAKVMVERYTTPQFPAHGPDKAPSLTAWDNHRWTRYRALVSALPTFLTGYARGRAAFGLDPAQQRSYRLSGPDIALAESLLGTLDQAVDLVDAANPSAVARLVDEPRPQAVVRRVPHL
jgi:hypothetical protein